MADTTKPKTWQPSAVPGDEKSASSVTRNCEDEKWDRFIDVTLTEWKRDPAAFEDEGMDSPSAERICQAIEFARHLKDRGLPAPTRVVPDPNGGIVFERQAQDAFEQYHFWDDGVVEYLRFQGTRLVERRRVA